MMPKYTPEGIVWNDPENKEYISGVKGLEKAAREGRILEGIALSCNSRADLTVGLGGALRGIIPRKEAFLPLPDRQEKDIAIISRVGKPVCFKVLGIVKDEYGAPMPILSRRLAQEECFKNKLRAICPGDVIDARVTHEEPFGAFVDVGCGVVSLLSIDSISVSRIPHPSDRFLNGEYLRVAVKSVDRMTGRIAVTRKELLGSWAENAALFEPGQTVTGMVRSIEDYGIFVELTPNLAGLAEYREGVRVGQKATVFIKSINPERMKVKLVLIDSVDDGIPFTPPSCKAPPDLTHIDRWRYSPPESKKIVETVFCENG